MKKILLLSTILLFGLSAYSHNPCNVTDKGVMINGVRWATRNVDKPGTFAESPESFGMLFQWNLKKGWNATDEEREGWDSSTISGIEWREENDPCPEGWRVPNHRELFSLEETDSEWTTQNGVNGRLFGTAPYQIFLPAAGLLSHTVVTLYGVSGDVRFSDANERGRYWSSTGGISPDRWGAWAMLFNNRHVIVGNVNPRPDGYSVRCVALGREVLVEVEYHFEVLVEIEYEIFETK